MADATAHIDEHHGQAGFFTRWFMSTNHKDIGILYIVSAAVVGFISVLFTVFMRMELLEPGVQHMCLEGFSLLAAAAEDCTPNGHLWNVMITGHGILMMFFVVIPALFGGFRQLFHAPDDRRPRHGVPAAEQPQLLDVHCRLLPGHRLCPCPRRKRPGRFRSGLGALCSTVDAGSRHVDGSRDLRRPRVRCIVDSRRDQHDHDIPEHEGTGDDASQGAVVRLVDLRNGLADPAVPARPRPVQSPCS